MARLRIFVSSTCYDLGTLRSELRPFILNLGYEPVMSEYSDVLFDPRSHTHESCVKEIEGCDMVILIVGSRFGGTAVPSALECLDFDGVEKLSTKPDLLKSKDKLSITQLEVLKAVEVSLPVYAFADNRVLHDHHVYERNKGNSIVIDNIEFPSIQKKETAKYVFEFINFLSHRAVNNTMIGFSRLDEIRTHLATQWSQLFQRLLYESRTSTTEAKRYRDFSERLDELKSVVLASISTPDLRVIANGVIRFRHLIHFLSGLQFPDLREALIGNQSWNDLLAMAEVDGVVEIPNTRRIALTRTDDTIYLAQGPIQRYKTFESRWDEFRQFDSDSRKAIVDALLQNLERTFPLLRPVQKSLEEFLAENNGDEGMKIFVSSEVAGED